jgi:hypothetical protein
VPEKTSALNVLAHRFLYRAKKQEWFNGLQAKVDDIRHHQEKIATKRDAFLPSILDRAFKGEL